MLTLSNSLMTSHLGSGSSGSSISGLSSAEIKLAVLQCINGNVTNAIQAVEKRCSSAKRSKIINTTTAMITNATLVNQLGNNTAGSYLHY
jgi:hypothetical protein